jgi:hypothetical protein
MAEPALHRAITGPVAEPHPIEHCYGSRLHCWSHNADEPGEPPVSLYPAGGFPVLCFECKHVFRSPAELLAEDNKVLAAFGDAPETDVNRVYCCPLCAHDW